MNDDALGVADGLDDRDDRARAHRRERDRRRLWRAEDVAQRHGGELGVRFVIDPRDANHGRCAPRRDGPGDPGTGVLAGREGEAGDVGVFGGELLIAGEGLAVGGDVTGVDAARSTDSEELPGGQPMSCSPVTCRPGGKGAPSAPATSQESLVATTPPWMESIAQAT